MEELVAAPSEQPPPLPPPRLPPRAARAVAAIERPFEFRGEAREYFRIWIVNLALGIVTLGVYSAWAKVRSERYFYGNTGSTACRSNTSPSRGRSSRGG
jgi:hypothetical protein